MPQLTHRSGSTWATSGRPAAVALDHRDRAVGTIECALEAAHADLFVHARGARSGGSPRATSRGRASSADGRRHARRAPSAARRWIARPGSRMRRRGPPAPAPAGAARWLAGAIGTGQATAARSERRSATHITGAGGSSARPRQPLDVEPEDDRHASGMPMCANRLRKKNALGSGSSPVNARLSGLGEHRQRVEHPGALLREVLAQNVPTPSRSRSSPQTMIRRSEQPAARPGQRPRSPAPALREHAKRVDRRRDDREVAGVSVQAADPVARSRGSPVIRATDSHGAPTR